MLFRLSDKINISKFLFIFVCLFDMIFLICTVNIKIKMIITYIKKKLIFLIIYLFFSDSNNYNLAM
jgi:hypothetical protein